MPPRPGRSRRGEQGAAVVEFTMVTVLLLTLFAALLQLGFALHVRNTLVASAAEGARYAATADRDPAEGAAVSARLIADALSPRYAREVSADREVVDGTPTVVVRVRAELPLLGPVGLAGRLTVAGHAVDEGR